jgi:Uma2 family endonuclease
MATAIKAPSRHVLLHNISWGTYEAILRDMQDRVIRMTYDRGELEFMSPSDEHEWIKTLLGRMIETMSEVRNIPIRSAGSTTLRRELQQRGLEPDECYYVAHEPQMRGHDRIDLEQDPPPDLAVEVDISRSCLDRMSIYASLGFPEIWRYEDGAIIVYTLQEVGSYVRQSSSPSFPFLPMGELGGFLARRKELDETSLIRSFRKWAAELA